MLKRLRQETGQGMVEYALIIGLIAIIIVVTLLVIFPDIQDMYTGTRSAVSSERLGARKAALSEQMY